MMPTSTINTIMEDNNSGGGAKKKARIVSEQESISAGKRYLIRFAAGKTNILTSWVQVQELAADDSVGIAIIIPDKGHML